MPIARITRQGLAAIALSVALLWGFIVIQHVENARALAERGRLLRDLDHIQHRNRPQPVWTPKLGIEHGAPLQSG